MSDSWISLWAFREMLTRVDREWVKQAACRGMDVELFFPTQGESTKEAKEACGKCPVRRECLDYSIVTGEKYGIWGGRAERSRRPLRRAIREAG